MIYTDILKKIGIFFWLLVVIFIIINILITIYTYINMRIRTGNFIEGFENKNIDKEKISSKIMNVLKGKNCLSKINDNLLDLDKYNIGNENINNCPAVNSQTPFVGILQTRYNCDEKINIYR